MKSEIVGEDPLSEYALGYLSERVRNSFYDYVLRRFHEAADQEGLTKAKLARRLGLKPARVTRLLGSPGNWTLDTASELLVGICREELQPKSASYLDRSARNLRPMELIRLLSTTQNKEEVKREEEAIRPQINSGSALAAVRSTAPQGQVAMLSNFVG